MQESSLSLQSKSKPTNLCPTTTIQTQYSTIDPPQSDIDNIQLVSDDSLKMSHCQPQTFTRDSVHLQIQLDDGKVEIIFPQIYDDPLKLAKKFCEQHQLDQEMIHILTQNIKKTIQRLKNNLHQQKPKRFATQPADYLPKQQNHKKFGTNSKNNAPSSRDFFKKTESNRQSLMDPLSQKSLNTKQPTKSSKRQHPIHYESVRTQASIIKTEPFDDKQIRKALINKQNQQNSTFDYFREDTRVKNMKKRDKIEIFMKRNCNFQPQINLSAKKISSNRSFDQRLKTSVRNSSQKDIKNKKAAYSSVQSSKGSLPKHYFKLETLKQSQKPIVAYSLKNFNKNDPNLSKQPKSSSTKSIFIPSGQPSKNTQKLYENQKQKAFRSIFCLLDDDQDGIISILNINLINGVEQKLIQIMFPVLEELEILETELNQSEFCNAMNKLFGSLSVDEKGFLLKYCQNLTKQQKRRQESEPLKTTMTPISEHLVTQTERNNMSVYEYSKIRQELKQQKLQQQRILKERSVMRNCTFHPKTNPKKPIYF